ncbi:MAG: class I SAM-dependent methyltransferase [Alphaproteobacteria bacterium]|nr:class I SAM-dependent methyltransferase [Alphaproteobacteria bacterium]
MKKISTTAYMVASGLVKLSELPRWSQYFTPDIVQLNRAFIEHSKDTSAKHFVNWLSPAAACWLVNFMFIPGMVEHYLFRKLWIERQLAAAIQKGVRQVVVLGGGFDTLALRRAKKHTEVEFFEIDLPITQHTKISILQQIGYAIPENCRFKAADLSQKALGAILLTDYHFKQDAPTLVILEGVLMYLDEAEVKGLFADLRRLFNGHLQILFGAIAAPDAKSNIAMRITNALLGRAAEATRWHCSISGMPAFISELGFSIKELISYKDLQKAYRNEKELRQVPDEDENYYIVTKSPQT